MADGFVLLVEGDNTGNVAADDGDGDGGGVIGAGS